MWGDGQFYRVVRQSGYSKKQEKNNWCVSREGRS